MSRLRVAGLLITLAAVVILVVSLVAGLGGDTSAVPAARETRQEGGLPDERVRVEVLNAAGIEGLARAATRTLRERGVDVVYFGNASRFGRDTSVVIDRVGRPEAARRVANVLGITQVRSQPDTSLYLEATVVLGTDWADSAEPFPLDSVP